MTCRARQNSWLLDIDADSGVGVSLAGRVPGELAGDVPLVDALDAGLDEVDGAIGLDLLNGTGGEGLAEVRVAQEDETALGELAVGRRGL